jgi:hypothetical protein
MHQFDTLVAAKAARTYERAWACFAAPQVVAPSGLMLLVNMATTKARVVVLTGMFMHPAPKQLSAIVAPCQEGHVSASAVTAFSRQGVPTAAAVALHASVRVATLL